MFPDFEPDVLSAVLASCEGNMAAAVEVLLSMNEERIISSSEGAYGAAALAEGALANANQLAQDEQLARQLEEAEQQPAAEAQQTQDVQFEQDELLARELQQQILADEEEQMVRLAAATPGRMVHLNPEQLDPWDPYIAGGQPQPYPGAQPARAGAAGANHPSVHRPAEWGAAGPGAAAHAPADDAPSGSIIGRAGSAVASLLSWASSDEPAAVRRKRGEDPFEGMEAQEMQPLRRVQPFGAEPAHPPAAGGAAADRVEELLRERGIADADDPVAARIRAAARDVQDSGGSGQRGDGSFGQPFVGQAGSPASAAASVAPLAAADEGGGTVIRGGEGVRDALGSSENMRRRHVARGNAAESFDDL